MRYSGFLLIILYYIKWCVYVNSKVLIYPSPLPLVGEGNGNPLQYSCLENPMNGGAWWAVVHGITKSWIQLSDFTFTFSLR